MQETGSRQVMAWFKVDDGWWSHPKTLQLSPQAIALWVRAGSWSCQHLTDGFISDSTLTLFGYKSVASRDLVEAGFWEKADGGFQFHDWADYQEKSEIVRERRERARERMRAVRANKAETNGEVRSTPTRPDPTRPVEPKGSTNPHPPAPPSEFMDEFTDWYFQYPRKESQPAAIKAYKEARNKVSAEVLILGAKRYAEDPNRQQRYTKMPATWLKNECWNDEPLPALPAPATPVKPLPEWS
jgi:hypothetical protein